MLNFAAMLCKTKEEKTSTLYTEMAKVKRGTLTKFEIEIWVVDDREWNRTESTMAQEETESLNCLRRLAIRTFNLGAIKA
jgi:hypothetical protein